MPLLDLHPDRITYASDYFGEMVATATGLIQAGFLYADDTPSEEVRPHGMNHCPITYYCLPNIHCCDMK
jgi:glutamyl/glutaminyl-tRNA synthetase